MKASTSPVDPVPPSAYPSFQPVTTPPPSMPTVWTATPSVQLTSVHRSDARQSVLPTLYRQHRVRARGVFLGTGRRLLLRRLVVLHHGRWDAALDRRREHVDMDRRRVVAADELVRGTRPERRLRRVVAAELDGRADGRLVEDPGVPPGLAPRRDMDVVRFHHRGAGAHDVR